MLASNNTQKTQGNLRRYTNCSRIHVAKFQMAQKAIRGYDMCFSRLAATNAVSGAADNS
jgi:hypothetical protein